MSKIYLFIFFFTEIQSLHGATIIDALVYFTSSKSLEIK